MKKLALVLTAALSALLSGCVAYVPDGGHDRHYHEHDRDHDGVPNRDDRAPDNPYRR